MSTASQPRTEGCLVPLPVFLTVMFVVLKLTGNISWSWVWVLSPLWISLGMTLVITLTCTALAGVFVLRR